MRRILMYLMLTGMMCLPVLSHNPKEAEKSASPRKVLVLAERGGLHEGFTSAGLEWLEEQKEEAAAVDVGDGRFTRHVRREIYHGEPVLTIPEGYTEIRPGACAGLDSITEVRLPSTLQKICSGAFSECTSLRVLDIPASVVTLEEDAFEDCDALSMVAVPSHLAKEAKACFPNVDLAILD